jgi:AsmA protein
VSSVWPDDPFDLSGLTVLDADLSLSVAKLTIAGLEIAVPELKAALKEGTLALDAKNVALEGAKITGTASVNARDPQLKLAAKFKALGVDPEAWFELFNQEARFVGKSTVEVDVSGSGNSQRKLIDTLTGRIKAATSKGAIVGYDLNSLLGVLAALTGQYDASWRTPFDELEADVALTNGIAKKSSVEVTGSIIGVNGNGVVRLPSQEIDYRARLTLVSWGQSAAVHILGGWLQPKVDYSYATSDTARALVQQDPLEPLKGADLKDPELATLAAQVLKKGADKGALSPQLTGALQALKARAEGGK